MMRSMNFLTREQTRRAHLPIYLGLKRSNRMVLLAVAFIVFTVTGCGTLKNGRGWAQDAVYPVELKRIPRAAFNALVDPETLIPVAGAISKEPLASGSTSNGLR
jgi:hypothetical protein